MKEMKKTFIINKLNDISKYLNKKDLYNLIEEMVSLTGQIIEYTKSQKFISQLKKIKNKINEIYSSDLNQSKKIIEIIDILNGKNTIKKSLLRSSTFNSKINYILIEEKGGNNIVKFKTGDEYKGQLKDKNIYDGKGEYYYSNGDKYIGEYKNNKKEGLGIYYYKEGDKYEGEYKNDQMDGRGVYIYNELEEGLKYEGDWKNGLKEGKGIYTLKNGDKYEGDFKNDNFEGWGIYFFSNGDIYEGEFKNDKFDGRGIFYYNDGSREMGNYEGGEPMGIHIMMSKNGEADTIEY